MAFDLGSLKTIKAQLSAENGVSTTDLRKLLTSAYAGDRSVKDVNDYRLGKRPWKKLRDEVSPVSDFLTFIGEEGRVRFPLDNETPDAWFCPFGQTKVGIEVTRALGRTDYELTREMVRVRTGRGFLGLHEVFPSFRTG